ncbi:hypothetical protein B0H14DRAFT_27984 [Mycena olivaceomarginata]|nr:hypothetical protein B0H14DRAFT_27984 [Mycena olivaceomarginata]
MNVSSLLHVVSVSLWVITLTGSDLAERQIHFLHYLIAYYPCCQRPISGCRYWTRLLFLGRVNPCMNKRIVFAHDFFGFPGEPYPPGHTSKMKTDPENLHRMLHFQTTVPVVARAPAISSSRPALLFPIASVLNTVRRCSVGVQDSTSLQVADTVLGSLVR